MKTARVLKTPEPLPKTVIDMKNRISELPSMQPDSFGEYRLNSALNHTRTASLGQPALSLYIALARLANSSGHVSSEDAGKVTASDEAVRELVASDLVDIEPDGNGVWIVHPETLDLAEIFADGREP